MTAAISATRRGIRELADGTIRVQVDIDPPYRADFHKLFPEIGMPVAIAPLAPDFEQSQEPGDDFGDEAALLHRSGFFYVQEVLKALGTDDDFREWVQRQPSCLTGKFSEYVDGEGRCVAAHVRRSGESGTAFKAEYACVPLTDEEHQWQHQHGESDCLRRYRHPQGDHEEGKEWFDKQRNKYVQQWGHQRLCQILGLESLKMASCSSLIAWAETQGVEKYLPRGLCAKTR